MDVRLSVDPFAVCVYGAECVARLLGALAGAEPLGQGGAYLKLLGAQLGIALKEFLIVGRIEPFLPR